MGTWLQVGGPYLDIGSANWIQRIITTTKITTTKGRAWNWKGAVVNGPREMDRIKICCRTV